MSITRLRFRLLMLAAAAGFLAIALTIRAAAAGTLNSTGRLEQYSGTALYASMAYAGGGAEAVETVTSAMADGLTTSIAPAEQILGILGALVIAHASRLSPEAAEPVVRAIQQAAIRCSVDVASALRLRLVAILADQGDVFGLVPFENPAAGCTARKSGSATLPASIR